MYQELLVEQEDEQIFTPICGGNLVTPVTDSVHYCDELHYTIGGRVHIENAD